MINPRIVKIIEKNGFNQDDVLVYLLSLHYNLKPSFIPEIVKKQTNLSGIINRDFDSGTIQWIVPLFIPITKSETITKITDWSWVAAEYRKMFTVIRKDAGGDAAGCINKMKVFFKENPKITKEDVIRATELYLSEFRSGKNNPNFLQQANYFIFKSTKGRPDYQSRLSQYLEMLTDNSDKPKVDKYMRGVQ